MSNVENERPSSAKIQEQDNDEQLEELAEVSEKVHSLMDRSWLFERSKGYLFTVLAVIIALGQYSEAVALIGDGIDSIRSEFTNDIEYDKISKIHVGITASYAEEVLGLPQVAKSISKELTANYFYDEKFLMTLFYQDGRVEAYSVIALVEGFYPLVFRDSKTDWSLADNAYDSFPANPQTYIVDHSKTASYYLEKLDKGRAGLFVNSYLGNLSYGAQPDQELIAQLYSQEVHGSDALILASQTALRASQKPNFYGEGVLDLTFIEKSLLTGVEFQSYFGRH